MGRRSGGSGAVPNGSWRSAGAALRRALALALLSTLAAPASHAALTSTSSTIRVVVADVGAHSFSASLRATSGSRVGQVAYVVWDTADCGGVPTDDVVKAGQDCNGVALDASRRGQVDLKTLWNPVEVRAGPGLLSQTNYSLFLADANKTVIGLSVVTLDDTPPTYAPGTPRVLAVGELGASFVVGLDEPGLLRYVLQSSVASPPSLSDVLTGVSTIQRVLPVGGAVATEYVLDGIQGDSSYALYLAASDVATPTPNTKARLEVMLFTTPLCDPCTAGRRLPLAADCACAVGSPFQVRVGVLPGDFDARLFVRALAAYLGLLPSQVVVTSVTTFGDPALVGDEVLQGDQVTLTNLTNVTAFSDKTLVAFELLPLRPPKFYDWEVLSLTSAVVNSTLVPTDEASPWPAVFGGVMLISAPSLPGPPATFILESSLPLGRVFPRYQAANPLLDFDGWVRPSVPAEAIGKHPSARFVFGATLGGGAVRGPCTTCTFLCRLDVGAWEPCTSPYVVGGLTVGEHLFQVRAFAADGTVDPVAAFYTWAIDLGPWVGFVVRPPAAVNTSLLNFAFASASGCALTYSLNGVAWLPIAGAGTMSTPVLFTLPGSTTEGMNTLQVACTLADNTTVTAKHSWRLDTVAPTVTLLSGELVPGAVVHRDTAAWLVTVNDTDALSGPGSGVASVQCRLVDSTNATSPAPLFDWTPCPAALQGTVNATGLLALANGNFSLQMFATDHAGSASDIVAAPFQVDVSLPLTPTASVVNLVVTLAPDPSAAKPAFYQITNVLNGLLLLANSAAVAGGTFVAEAAAAAGLTFVPTSTLFSGDRQGSTFGFDVQAADASNRLGGEVLSVSLSVPHINTAPVLDASRPLFLRDAYNTGAALYNTALGELVADVLATGVTDADEDPVGLAVIFAASPLGAWEASADGGVTWFSLAAASAAWPMLVGGGTSDRLRFVPQLDHPGVLSTTDWAATASLAFYAWDGSDGSMAGASCKLVSVYSPEAEAASARNSSLLILVRQLRAAANGSTVCVPFDTTYAPSGPFSADAGVAVVRVFDVASVRITDADARAARSAASAFAGVVAGCPPKHPNAVDLPVSQAGAALMLTTGSAPLPDLAPPWTVEAWVRKRARLPSTIFMASSSYPATNSVALLLECSGAQFTVGVRRVWGWPSGPVDLSFGVEVPLETWTHLAFVDDGQVLSLFVNGTLAAPPLALGGVLLPSGSVGYNMSASAFVVDELRIWSVARSALQVAAAVQAQIPAAPGSGAAPAVGLLYSLRFEEGCGNSTTDTASQNVTAALVGGASFARGVSLACVEVAGVFPEEGPPAGGGVITLLGSGFPAAPSADAACVFSNGLYSQASIISNSSVSCVVPPAMGDGAVRVSYSDPGLGCYAADSAIYTYASAFVAGIHPTQGPVAGGTLVTLLGSGFHAAPGAAVCRFTCLLAEAGASTWEAWRVSASLLQCETPTRSTAGACLVDVSLNGGVDWVPHPQLFTFVGSNGTFTVRKSSPGLLQTGPTTGGGLLRVLLPPNDFGPLSRATLPACGIGTLRPLAARLAGANSIECVSPARVRGASSVTVSVNGRDWEALGGGLGPRRFVVHSPPAAVAVLPEEAPAVGGALLTVFGSGGAAAWDLSCVFGSSSADGVAPADARTARGLGVQLEQGVQCIAPSVAPGFVAIRLAGDGVTGPNPRGGVLQFLAREAPLTSGAFPRVLDAGGGTLLAVTGSHFAPSMLCAFANRTTAPVHFVSTALVQCEAPPGAPGLNTVAILPALRVAAPPDDQDSGAVRVAYAAGVADPAASADGVPLGILCAFRAVRIAASAGPDGAVDCRLPVGFAESSPAGLGNDWQDVAYGASDAIQNVTDGLANLTSLRGRLEDLAAFPESGSSAGFTQLSVFAAVPAQLLSSQFSCQFLEAGRVTTVQAATGSNASQCTVPPALSSLGGFAVVRLSLSASGATVDIAETQFMYSPPVRVTNVALPRVTALATDGRGRVHPGRLLWSGRPVAVSGAHFTGATSIACRFGSEIRPAAWVSTALVRCELTDTAAVDPPSPVAVAERAADDASWSAAASCAVFSWLR